MVQDTPYKISVAIPSMPDADMVLSYLRCMDMVRYCSNFGPLVEKFKARGADFLLSARLRDCAFHWHLNADISVA